MTSAQDIQKIPVDQIYLDYKNPRISEFGVLPSWKQVKVLKLLWEEMAVNELMLSIIANGFWEFEPLIVMEENGRNIVIEGNRRLAAVKLLHNPELTKVPASITGKISQGILDQTAELPAIVVQSREASWRYIGFKHVNGPAKWGSYAKARYISEIHNTYGVPISEIAEQIGDTNRTARKLYQGLMVLEQAKVDNVYDYEDIFHNRIYFSHLYTGLQREGIRKYLSLADEDKELKKPVPEEKQQNLGELLRWMFGSKSEDLAPVIQSQNPDLKYLDQVLQDRAATLSLKQGDTLEVAYETSRADDALFEEQLLVAKRSLQKAKMWSTTGYDGDENLLRIAGSVAELADDLYEEMEKKNLEQTKQKKKQRKTE